MIRKLESGEYRCYSGKIAGALFQIGFWPWRVLLAVAVIAVAGRHSSGDDQKPDPPDVTAIIQTIRQAEELFRNMEFAYTWEVIALPSGEQQVEEAYRVIRQGEWVHISMSKSQKDGAIPEMRQQAAYDGKMTRIAQYDASGKHSNGWLTFGKALPGGLSYSPLTLGFYDNVKLSTILDDPSSSNPRVLHEVVWKSAEMIDGLRVVKAEGKTNAGKTEIWLAVDRHYIPVKMHEVYHGSSDSASLTEVNDWKEIEPGIVVPFQVVRTWFKDKDGKPTPHQRNIFRVTHISREPRYGLAFFQDVPLPKGLPVFVQKDGKIIQKFVQPETGEMKIPPMPEEVPEVAEPSGTRAEWVWAGAAAGLVFVVCLGAMYCIGRFRSKRPAR